MNLLEVKSISKTYGSGEAAVQALKNVSFSVPRGEFVAVVGESGSGKSTLLNMIGALDVPDSGKVLIDGRDTFSMKESSLTVFRRRNIGFIFQAFNLIPELTVEQNIIFPVLLDYHKPDGKYLEDLLGVLELEGEQYVSTSGDYEKYFIQDGRRYHHILDPATGCPADAGLISVTVLGENGAVSDGLSTACFVLGKEKGAALLEEYGAEGIFVDQEKNVYVTDDLMEDFRLEASGYVVFPLSP